MIRNFLSVSAYGGGALGALLFSLVVVHLFGVDVLGQFSVMYSLAQFVTLLARRGMGVALARYVAGEKKMLRINGLIFCNKRGFKASLLGLLALLIVSICFLFNGSFDYFITGFFLSFSVIPGVYMFIYSGYMRGVRQVFKSALFTNGYVFLFVSCGLIILSWFGINSVGAVAFTFVMVQFTWVFILSRKFVLFLLKNYANKKWSSHHDGIVSSSNNMSASNVFSSFFSIISVFLVGCFVSDEEVGYFKIFTQIITLATFVTSVLTASVSSQISADFKTGNLEKLQQTSAKLSFMQLLALPFCVMGSFLHLYVSGALFIEVLPGIAFILMFFALISQVIYGSATNWLNLTKYDAAVRKVLMIIFLPLIILFSYFAFKFGLVGAVLCLFMGFLLQTMALYFMLRAKIPINYPSYQRLL